jgi:hypothetical protein
MKGIMKKKVTLKYYQIYTIHNVIPLWGTLAGYPYKRQITYEENARIRLVAICLESANEEYRENFPDLFAVKPCVQEVLNTKISVLLSHYDLLLLIRIFEFVIAGASAHNDNYYELGLILNLSESDILDSYNRLKQLESEYEP